MTQLDESSSMRCCVGWGSIVGGLCGCKDAWKVQLCQC